MFSVCVASFSPSSLSGFVAFSLKAKWQITGLAMDMQVSAVQIFKNKSSAFGLFNEGLRLFNGFLASIIYINTEHTLGWFSLCQKGLALCVVFLFEFE